MFLSCAALAATPLPACAQDNYEIQVYGYDTVDPGRTMVELHSNFTIDGSKTVVDGMLPTNHAEHETIEITHGVTDWFEVGFYIFTSKRAARECSGSATTSARESGFPRNGIGRSG